MKWIAYVVLDPACICVIKWTDNFPFDWNFYLFTFYSFFFIRKFEFEKVFLSYLFFVGNVMLDVSAGLEDHHKIYYGHS